MQNPIAVVIERAGEPADAELMTVVRQATPTSIDAVFQVAGLEITADRHELLMALGAADAHSYMDRAA